MNARTPFPLAGHPLPTPPRRSRRDQEFLPAALELLETPPSPVGVALIWIICALAAAALAWSWFGRLDVVASAEGKIQPTGRVKVVQPLEAGRVAAIRVENGQRVARGEDLVVFDAEDADADVKAFSTSLAAFRAEAARRHAARAAVQSLRLSPLPPIAFPDGIPEPLREREALVLAGDLGQLEAQVASLKAQQAQRQFEHERLAATIAAQQGLVATLRQRVDMRTILEQSGSGSKAVVIDAMEPLQTQQATLATAIGQLAESRAAVAVLGQEIARSTATFLAENLQKLAEAERQADDLDQKLAKARLRQRRTVLVSPIDGTVSALSVTTIGQVVGAGDETMRIVPDGIGIEIECYLANRDIGFVKPGQEAVVKIESLPFTRYGTVPATLVRVGTDAIPQPEADLRAAEAARPSRDHAFAAAQRMQNLVFPATLRLDRTSVTAEGAPVPLSPGMAVTVEIKTGSRRILEYVFSPLVEVVANAMKER